MCKLCSGYCLWVQLFVVLCGFFLVANFIEKIGSGGVTAIFVHSATRHNIHINFRIPDYDCVTLNACSLSPALNKYLHMETKEKNLIYTRNKRATHEYTSL